MEINITKAKIVEYFKALGCIAIGTFAGILCYWFCLYINLAIFGWNLGLLISPLLAGYVETKLAKRFLKETTGAVSAFILFLVTVIYGFFINNPTLGGNLLTIGSFGMILQAALPTLVNYFIIVMGVSAIAHTLGVFRSLKRFFYRIYDKLYYIFTGKEKVRPIQNDKTQLEIQKELIDINELGVLLSTSKKIKGKSILEYKGIYESREILKYDEKEIIILNDYEKVSELLMNDIKYTKGKAFEKLANNLKEDGCNGILEIDIQYDTIKKDKTNLIIQISIIGTGVVIA